MKKLIIIIFLVFNQFSFSQQDNFKSDVIKLIDKTGFSNSIKFSKAEIIKLIPNEHKESFSKDFDDSVVKHYDYLALEYMKVYTHQDVIDLLKFYETPIGKKKYSNDILLMEKMNTFRLDLELLIKRYMN